MNAFFDKLALKVHELLPFDLSMEFLHHTLKKWHVSSNTLLLKKLWFVSPQTVSPHGPLFHPMSPTSTSDHSPDDSFQQTTNAIPCNQNVTIQNPMWPAPLPSWVNNPFWTWIIPQQDTPKPVNYSRYFLTTWHCSISTHQTQLQQFKEVPSFSAIIHICTFLQNQKINDI